jgi:excisionase family DNA binding protein
MARKDKLLDPASVALKTDRLLSAGEAASLLGLKPGTMYDLVAKGQVGFIKLFGKTVRFRESVILRIIADSEVVSTNPPTFSGTLKRKRQKTNGKASPEPLLQRRGCGPDEAIN